MEQIFKKWYPYDNLDTMYDVDDIWMRQDGYTLILLPDGRYKEELEGQRLMFTWESIVSYQLSGEHYREKIFGSPILSRHGLSGSDCLNPVKRPGKCGTLLICSPRIPGLPMYL